MSFVYFDILKYSIKRVFLMLILIITLSSVYSQNSDKRTYQTSFAKPAPVIDGLMNDKSWDNVAWSTGFIQSQPVENKPPSQETSFKVMYDDDNIYFFIRAWDSEPEKISRIISRRDNSAGDRVDINIDSYFDKQTSFSFTAMASGAKGDQVISQDGNSFDDTWNPIWYLETSIDDKGWCAEIKIPLSQLRFGKKENQIWGLEITREIYRLQERSFWQFIPKGSPGYVHLFGELHGIKNLKPKRQIELMPYSVGRIERSEKIEGDPFNTGKAGKISAGLDGKVGISNNFTLDFTINPDFGQVEADPSEVNLTAFESYFSERRPFFVEGKNIFQFEPNQTNVPHNMFMDNLFYSRRIGRYPHNYPDVGENEYVKMPESTTILGAIKISGKTKEGLSVGILESVTQEEHAVIENEGSKRKETVEPLTNYFLGRVQKDFNKGETVVGGIFTAVNRDIDTSLFDYLHKSAYTAGIDFQRNWKERTWYVAGNAEFSNVKGKPEAIINTQKSSARYFQRPDSKYHSVDSTLTSLAGYGGTVKLGKSSEKRLQFETSMTLRSPGLEFNDIGYMRYSDVIHQGIWVGYNIRNPFAIFNRFNLNGNHWMYWNFSGDFLSSNANVNFWSEFKNRWQFNGQFNRRSENISTDLLRGGPSFIQPGSQNFSLYLSTDQSKKISFGLGNFHASGDSKSNLSHDYWASMNVRPSNSILFSIEPEYSIQNQALQFVNIMGTDDPVYFFGELNQETMAVTFRVNYTLNPELSIEYYGQPFVSAGKYTSFKKITDPKADAYDGRYRNYEPDEISYNPDLNNYSIDENKDNIEDFAIDNPDFNFRQFRSNLVIRWEYLPGSTIYLVWSQGRTSSDSNGLFSYGSDMKSLFSKTPLNVFLLKFSYWFAL
jgi:hypothetical protein